MPDSPPQAIHGLLSAYPGRDDSSATRCSRSFYWHLIKSRRNVALPARFQSKHRWLRQGESCPGGRGSRQARHGWRAPESGHGCPAEGKATPGRQGTASHRSPHQLLLHRRSEEHTSELQSRENLVCRLLLEKKKK